MVAVPNPSPSSVACQTTKEGGGERLTEYREYMEHAESLLRERVSSSETGEKKGCGGPWGEPGLMGKWAV